MLILVFLLKGIKVYTSGVLFYLFFYFLKDYFLAFMIDTVSLERGRERG